jgi:hypothetical protein
LLREKVEQLHESRLSGKAHFPLPRRSSIEVRTKLFRDRIHIRHIHSSHVLQQVVA